MSPTYFSPDDYESDQQAIADGLFAIAHAIRLLGNAEAATPMGAIEALGLVFKEGFATLASAVEEQVTTFRTQEYGD